MLLATNAAAAIEDLREAIQAHTRSPADLERLVGRDAAHRLGTLCHFYSERGYEPALVGTPVAAELLAKLKGAAAEGLAPRLYRVEALEAALEETRSGEASQVASADVLLTHALLRYITHAATGRLDPRGRKWRTSPRELDPSALLSEVVAKSSLEPLRALAPPWSRYEALKGALAKLRELEAKGGWPRIPGGRPIEEGATDERIPLVAERLTLTGELTSPRTGEPKVYDPVLREAVQRFQARHGLVADGIIGAGTRRAMNVTVSKRIAQVELNLERWRWLPAPPEGRHSLVNAAGGELDIVEGGRTILHSRVVTGRPDWETPVIADEIVALHVNPSWHVPRTITVDEILDILRRNPGWAVRKGIRIQNRKGEWINPRAVDWKAVTAENLRYRLVQEPGPANPLGRYKFVLTNRLAIYLHDTPATHLFELPQRHLSHGCVRVEQAEAIAELLAKGHHEEPLARARESGQTEKIELAQPLPVFLLYFTAWVDEHGTLQHRDDVYRRDRRQAKALVACARKPDGKACR